MEQINNGLSKKCGVYIITDIITGKKYKKYYKLALSDRNKKKQIIYKEFGKQAFTKENAPMFTSLINSYEIIRKQQTRDHSETFEQVYKKADEIAKSYKAKTTRGTDKAVTDLLSSLNDLEGASGKKEE